MQVRKAYPKILFQSHGLRMFTRVTPILPSGQLQPSLPVALEEAQIELTNTSFLLSWKKWCSDFPNSRVRAPGRVIFLVGKTYFFKAMNLDPRMPLRAREKKKKWRDMLKDAVQRSLSPCNSS